MFRARAARPDDASDIAAAHIEGWRVGYRGVVPDDVLDSPAFAEEREDGWARRLAQGPERGLLVVEGHDGRPVGFAHVGPEQGSPRLPPHGRGEVHGFYLHPSAWGSDAATVLMDAAEDRLRALGFRTAVLWVLRDNPRARAFYEKSGWRPTGRDDVFERPGLSLPDVEYTRSL